MLGARLDSIRSAVRRWSPSTHIAAAVCLSVLLRLRFLFTPLLADEGGALSAARLWAQGGTPYRDLFVDRPQGVLLLFRWWDALPGATTHTARGLAIVLGATAVLGAAGIARVLGSTRAAVITAWLAAAVSAAPIIEGFAANGELLAAGLSVPGLAVAGAVLIQRRSTWWMVLAGLLSGAAMSVKQSAFDGAVAIAGWLLVALVFRWRKPLLLVTYGLAFAAGVAAVLVACVLHGRHLGWSDYVYAVYSFRIESRSALTNQELDKLALSVIFALPVLAVVALIALRALRRHSLRAGLKSERFVFLAAWCLAALASFAAGGSYHRHYFLILAVPMAVAAGVGAARRADHWNRRLVPVALAVNVIAALPFIIAPPLIEGKMPQTNVAVASWVRAERVANPQTTVYVYCASAAFYSELGDTPVYPYVWADHVRMGRGGQSRLLAYLNGPDAPRIVAKYQDDSQCDVDGRLAEVLQRRYVAEGTIGEATILRLATSPPLTASIGGDGNHG